jgi:hypothetical protein
MKFILPFAFFAILFYNNAIAQMDGEFNRSAYVKGIKKERLEKDKEMISDQKSPIPEEE